MKRSPSHPVVDPTVVAWVAQRLQFEAWLGRVRADAAAPPIGDSLAA